VNVTTSSPTPSPQQRLPRELVESATFLLKRLGLAVKERSVQAYEDEGLHPSHHGILLVLGEGSPETQGSIADTLGYDRGHLVGLLDELEDRGLLERRRDPNDRRRHVVQLTAEGKQTLRRLRAVSRQVEDEFLAPLSDQERTRLHALLLRLMEAHDPRCVRPKK
jgi:MarR family transcriptional regulator, lower aerobic nicotinate degradation pathway regulator